MIAKCTDPQPSGPVERLSSIPIDRYHTLTEEVAENP